MAALFGEKTSAWFDVWSLEHFVAGMSAYSVACMLVGWMLRDIEASDSRVLARMHMLVLLVMAYGWEALEHYLEAGATGIPAVTYWFQGVEFWGNRLITDPLLVLSGAGLAYLYPVLNWPARLFSLAWVGVHVFYFPHSMYLHNWL